MMFFYDLFICIYLFYCCWFFTFWFFKGVFKEASKEHRLVFIFLPFSIVENNEKLY